MKENAKKEFDALKEQPITNETKEGCGCKTTCRVCRCRHGKHAHHGTASAQVQSVVSH